MSDFIFLNPSPNLLKLTENIRSRGYIVKLVKNEQFPDVNAENIHVFYEGSYMTFFRNDPPQGKMSGFGRIRKGFLPSLVSASVKKELRGLSKDFACGDVVDLCLMKRRSLLESNIEISSVSSAASFSDIVEDNGNAVIVTGYMEFVAGSEKLSMYDTDFDLKEALGNDYFVFFTKTSRIEMCRSGNRLLVVGSRKDDHLSMLCDQMSFLKKFNFKRVKELIISRNRMPWIINHIDKGLVLLNDYSYFNVSVRLEPEWFDRVGKNLCADIRR